MKLSNIFGNNFWLVFNNLFSLERKILNMRETEIKRKRIPENIRCTFGWVWTWKVARVLDWFLENIIAYRFSWKMSGHLGFVQRMRHWIEVLCLPQRIFRLGCSQFVIFSWNDVSLWMKSMMLVECPCKGLLLVWDCASSRNLSKYCQILMTTLLFRHLLPQKHNCTCQSRLRHRVYISDRISRTKATHSQRHEIPTSYAIKIPWNIVFNSGESNLRNFTCFRTSRDALIPPET